ncbi:hypothetical protein Q7C36_009834 [Tachysurus vachellii]|uniref:Microtubule-associated protein 1A/B/S-like MBL-like domain-containing protein n=1 Tax=Tachysurus vachellii TaxID=175792 RepID=A0AA88MZZ7_TACVA|nr:hypothetical protein Q7C36_009834 [Tachysurus vachellii]
MQSLQILDFWGFVSNLESRTRWNLWENPDGKPSLPKMADNMPVSDHEMAATIQFHASCICHGTAVCLLLFRFTRHPQAKSSFPDRTAEVFETQMSKQAQPDHEISLVENTCDNLITNETPVEDQIIRVLFPGSTPQAKILEGREKLKHLEFLKCPVVCSKDIEPKDKVKLKSMNGDEKPKSVENGESGGEFDPKNSYESPEKSTDDILNPVKFTAASGNIKNPKTEHSVNLDLTPTEFSWVDGALKDYPPMKRLWCSPKSGPNSAGHRPYHISPEETWAASDRLAAKMCLGSDSQQEASCKTSESGRPKSTQEQLQFFYGETLKFPFFELFQGHYS